MRTSGFVLIPVTHPTQRVAECAKCGFSEQANTARGPLHKRSPIQNGHPSYIGAYVRTKCTSNSSRARNMVVAYWGCFQHKPISARYLVIAVASAYGLAVRWRLSVGYGSIDLMHWRHVSITTTPCWGSRLVALRARVVLAERIGAQPLSQCAGPGQPGGMACRGWPAGCMLGDSHVAVPRLTPNARGRPSVTSYA